MCQPAAPHAMKRRSMLDHSVRRVPPSMASSSQRLSPYSSTLGASTRVTFVSIGVGFPIQVSFTVPTVPRLASTSKGAHCRRCAGSVRASQTFSGENECPLLSVLFSYSRPAGRTRCVLCIHFLLLVFLFVGAESRPLDALEVTLQSIHLGGPEPAAEP